MEHRETSIKLRFAENFKLLQKTYIGKDKHLYISQEKFLNAINEQKIYLYNGDNANSSKIKYEIKDLSLRTLAKHLRGNSIPDISFLIKMSKLTDYSIDDILFRDLSIIYINKEVGSLSDEEKLFFNLIDKSLVNSDHPIIEFYAKLKESFLTQITNGYLHYTDRYIAFKSNNPKHLFSLYRYKNKAIAIFNARFDEHHEILKLPGIEQKAIHAWGGPNFGVLLPINSNINPDIDYADNKIESIIKVALLIYNKDESLTR